MEVLKYDTKEREAVFRYRQDVEPVLERNAQLRSMEQGSDWGRSVANVPNIILLQWMQEEWDRGNPIRFLSPEYYEMVWRKLQDSDFSKLRTDK